jgi:hypothetical protein
MRRGWFNERYRHFLAAKGIKTKPFQIGHGEKMRWLDGAMNGHISESSYIKGNLFRHGKQGGWPAFWSEVKRDLRHPMRDLDDDWKRYTALADNKVYGPYGKSEPLSRDMLIRVEQRGAANTARVLSQANVEPLIDHGRGSTARDLAVDLVFGRTDMPGMPGKCVSSGIPGNAGQVHKVPVVVKRLPRGHIYPVSPKEIKDRVSLMPKEDLRGLKGIEFSPPKDAQQRDAYAQYKRGQRKVVIFSQPVRGGKIDGVKAETVRDHIKDYVIKHEVGHHKALYASKRTDRDLSVAEARADANVVGLSPTDKDVGVLRR